MKDPLFLRLNEIIAIHSDQIARYGGSAGIRDMGLLQSAVAMPMSGFGGQYLPRTSMRWRLPTCFTS